MAQHDVFLTGATGFLGSSLAAELLRRGHRVRVLVRPGSESRVVQGCEIVHGDALRSETYAENVAPADTFVHLVGVAHPSPSKAEEFRKIDLVSCREAVNAAKQAGIRHFVYLSVARPAPMMKEYQAVRAEGERMIIESGIPASFVRPWYVLGPGRSWPVILKPFYAMARHVSFNPRRRESIGAGYVGTNDADAGLGGRESGAALADFRTAADQARRTTCGGSRSDGGVGLAHKPFTE